MSYGLEELLKQRGEIDAELRKHKSPITVMFTDLAGSTAFFARRGDTAGVAWIEGHNRLVIPEVEEYSGTVVKTIGDSVMAYFTDPKQGALSAKAIQQKLLAENREREAGDHLNIRVALHQGLGYLRGGDVFGDVVNVAARIAKACLPAQILISESVYLNVQSDPDMQARPVGKVQFHGKTSQESLYELLWTDEPTYARLREQFPPKAAPKVQEEDTGGRYKILNEVGHGAMGVVYKAYDQVIGRVVALKTIPLEVESEKRAALVDRLKQEARTAGMLDHPNIVTVYDVGEEAGLFYFTMQYVDGKTLASLREEKVLLPVNTILEIMEQVSKAVGFAHKAGVIHRDLKPSNIVLGSQGQVKVLDFGIAKLGDVGLTSAGMVLGTPSYLAPEQAAGRRIDHRADIFALGAVLYELLTCEKAFPGETTSTVVYKILNEEPTAPRAIEPSISPILDAIVRRALYKDPEMRFQSCEEFCEALGKARKTPSAIPTVKIKKEPLPAIVAKPTPSESSSSRGWILWVSLLVLLLGGAGAGWYFFLRPNATATSQPLVSPAATQPAPQPTATQPEPATAPASTAPPPTAQPSPSATEPKSETPAAVEAGTTKPAVEGATRTAAGKPKAPAGRPRREAATQGAETGEAKESKESGTSLFTTEDIPSLLAKADDYAGRGRYDRAIFLYQEILRVDPKNGPAREGLRRAKEAQGIRQ